MNKEQITSSEDQPTIIGESLYFHQNLSMNNFKVHNYKNRDELQKDLKKYYNALNLFNVQTNRKVLEIVDFTYMVATEMVTVKVKPVDFEITIEIKNTITNKRFKRLVESKNVGNALQQVLKAYKEECKFITEM